ncbi:MAG: hypothetical protein GY946_15380 [bacterium]|nr:hypothetical protein [bacterium]
MADSSGNWRRCSNCKNEIGFGQVYWVCSVSTCNRKRTGLVFCTTSCWDAHLPLMRHREAWAVEERAPSRAEYQREQSDAASNPAPEPREPRRIIASQKPRPSAPDADVPEEILVVASKLKKYVKARWGMNTSDAVMEVLSDRLRSLCDAAIHNATADERKTLMKRDFDR